VDRILGLGHTRHDIKWAETYLEGDEPAQLAAARQAVAAGRPQAQVEVDREAPMCHVHPRDVHRSCTPSLRLSSHVPPMQVEVDRILGLGHTRLGLITSAAQGHALLAISDPDETFTDEQERSEWA
jgi:hypothetical protein